MITRLDIRNYALIDELTVDFADGLTIITGETGAGKSIILGGLGLIMGQRADTKALFDDSRKCVIEAHFQVGAHGLQAFFEQEDLDYDDEMVIRREISPSGKTRSFVNDTPVRLTVLQDLSRSLIDLHQQFDTLDIHNVSFQLRMLDALADNSVLLGQYSHAYRAYKADQRELTRLQEERDKLREESDFVAFQLREFEDVDLQPNELEVLERELKTLGSAEEIKRVLGGAGMQLVEDETSVVGQVRDLLARAEALRGINTVLDDLLDRADGVLLELEDVGQQFISQAEDTEFDAERIEEVQARLSQIYKLQQKHGVTDVEALLAIQEGFQGRVRSTDQIEQGINALQESLATQLKVLQERALELRERRKAVVPDFTSRIHERLARLSMDKARLSIEFEELSAPSSTGLDTVTYLFSANKGSKLQRIKDVASGGELSRLTLVTKSLVASAIPLPTLIFDEIDAGVSGDVALRMGEILHELSEQHQVVTITHSPQVASRADKHYFVYKEEVGNRTATRVRELNKADRVKAIAVMLSSDPPSKPAIANAKGLLAAARG